KEALEWNPYNNSAKYWLSEAQQWKTIAEKVQPHIQYYSSKDLQGLFHRDPILLRHADEYPLIYLVLNRVPPKNYCEPQAWETAPDGKATRVSKPTQPKNAPQPSAQPTTGSRTPEPIKAGPDSSSQFTRLVERGNKALAERRYDEAADYLTEA